ncbi:tRNA (adenosine(37)-N6)-threonylcarbamoyltransferase complex dimerization subunit type 1 TsaB [Hydrogenophaga sp. PAMC20947]|uniref:tRNA (adenosine(37)-N6)-threonylcarbamoyltransferase complex dimerization subunit type 1 TsaB n=1 Tax=Hydrogenophaga sp. PAMC20947 TaxID=2565558 RepID=UPI00109E2371|nr:tRNA (adenosine(37)-N6)-threonylcarbamoyltransferase complex dimerization subunit type 1 TsaB [Hydrogenophaga sp. PAMC20947]QCB47940.1 tRNA (adenosine(37)-N6)-threonylcarbamoyltransferase complex dimerization subunit type 1 TsaB [Hydrogenophaga sp. PAMC20947]
MSPTLLRTPAHHRLLALETSTDQLSVAVGAGGEGGQVAEYNGPGAAQSSMHLLPSVQRLLTQVGWPLASLDAIVVARGPGSFTGLRTACAVAQGLAYGAQAASERVAEQGGLPVLPVDTLLALGEEARFRHAAAGGAPVGWVAAGLDARMGEMYVALYACGPEGLSPEPVQAPRLCAPPDWLGSVQSSLPPGMALTPGEVLWAGNAFQVYPEPLAGLPGPRVEALPTAAALLRLAPRLLAAGAAVAAADTLPVYVRDKVARTTDEREAARLAALGAA